MHLTVRFLGDVPHRTLRAVMDAIGPVVESVAVQAEARRASTATQVSAARRGMRRG